MSPLPYAPLRAGLLWAVMPLAFLPASGSALQGAGAGVRIQEYRFAAPDAVGLEQAQLTTYVFAAVLPLGRVSLDANGAYAAGEVVGPEGGTARLAGLTDTEVGLTLDLGSERALLRGSMTLPTGLTTLTLEEAAVAGVVANELLPFAIGTWGGGSGAGGDVALAGEAGPWGFGASVGYRAPTGYQPLADQTFTYRPGEQIQVTVAVDRSLPGAATLSVVGAVRHFGDDAVDEANLFRPGRRVEGLASLAFPVGIRGSASLHAGVQHRTGGAVLVDAPVLAGATDSPAQRLMRGGLSLRLPVGGATVVIPEVEARALRTDDGAGQGWLGSATLGADIRLAGTPFGHHAVLAPRAVVRRGRILVDDLSESDVTGWELGATLRFGVGR